MPQIVIDLGESSEKQRLLYQSKTKYVLYGGARGGGKSHGARTLAIARCVINPYYRVLILRETYSEVIQNFWRQLDEMIPDKICNKNKSALEFNFWNGSYIKLMNFDGTEGEKKLQGVEFDLIIIDEAGNFTPRAITYLMTGLRGGKYKHKQMVLTANPVGSSVAYLKRLFVDRDFITNSENPEENEDPSQYEFIPSTVEDNPYLDIADYTRALSQLPEDLRAAMRYGRWDTQYGNFFNNFARGNQTCKPFPIPASWTKTISIDYGFDMTAVTWLATDPEGRMWVYRSKEKKGLTIKEASQFVLENTPSYEHIMATYVPPDVFGTSKETGKSMFEVWRENGLYGTKANNNRVFGHQMIKDYFIPKPSPVGTQAGNILGRPETPMLMIFENCNKLIQDLECITADKKNPMDCSKNPHACTHTVDSLRYNVTMWNYIPDEFDTNANVEDDDEDSPVEYRDLFVKGWNIKTYI